MQRIAKRIVSFGLALVLCLALLVYTGPSAFGADDIQASRDEYNSLKAQKKEIDDRLKALEGSVASGKATAAQLEEQQALLREQIANLEKLVDAKMREIALQEEAIENKVAEINQKQQEYDDNYELYTERLVAIYKMNNSGLLSALLTADGWTEALTIANALQAISQHDTALLDDLEQKRIALEAQREDLQATLEELEAARAELDDNLQQLEDANAQLGWTISETYRQIQAEEQEMQRLADEREAIEAEMEEIWKNLAASTGEYVGGDLTWPVPGYNGDSFVSSRFGYRTLYGRSNFHTGTDIARGGKESINGADIVAANDGEVVLVSTSNARSGYGYYLIIDHGGGVRTLYAHCSAIYVSVGDYVRDGETIAAVGNTGNSTGPHLHFELRINNTQQVDAYPYLTGQKSL